MTEAFSQTDYAPEEGDGTPDVMAASLRLGHTRRLRSAVIVSSRASATAPAARIVSTFLALHIG